MSFQLKKPVIEQFIDDTCELFNVSDRETIKSNMLTLAKKHNLYNTLALSPSSATKKTKDPNEPLRLSGYNFFSSCMAKLLKSKGINFSLNHVSIEWKKISQELHDQINDVSKEFNALDRQKQDNEKSLYQDKVMSIISENITDLNKLDYKRDYNSYRVIRKQLNTLKINNDLPKLNDFWKEMKANKQIYDEFFDTFESYHPDFHLQVKNEEDAVDEDNVDNEVHEDVVIVDSNTKVLSTNVVSLSVPVDDLSDL